MPFWNSYLWSSRHAPGWAIFLLILLFFVVVWIGILLFFGYLSTTHSWIIPIFAVGLGAPRWCQILWSNSNIGQYLPWAGGPIASALLGRCLWLWLGVLDSIQGIGFGMILLQTMVRFHCSFALMAGQVIGAIATIVSRIPHPPISPNMLTSSRCTTTVQASGRLVESANTSRNVRSGFHHRCHETTSDFFYL